MVPVPETGNTGKGPDLARQGDELSSGHYENWEQKPRTSHI